MNESKLQQLVCEYLSLHHVFYFSIPNERWNITAPQMNRLKKMGLVPGMPDLAILHDETIYFLELKHGKGKLTPQQEIIIDRLRMGGYLVGVAWTFEEAVNYFVDWGIV